MITSRAIGAKREGTIFCAGREAAEVPISKSMASLADMENFLIKSERLNTAARGAPAIWLDVAVHFSKRFMSINSKLIWSKTGAYVSHSSFVVPAITTTA